MATPVEALLHVPFPVELASVVVKPLHTTVVPVIAAMVGRALIDIAEVVLYAVEQPPVVTAAL